MPGWNMGLLHSGDSGSGTPPPSGTRNEYILGLNKIPKLWSAEDIFAANLTQDRSRSVPMIHDPGYLGYGTKAGYTRFAISSNGIIYRALVAEVTSTADPSARSDQWAPHGAPRSSLMYAPVYIETWPNLVEDPGVIGRWQPMGYRRDTSWKSYASNGPAANWYARRLVNQDARSVTFEFDVPGGGVQPVTVSDVSAGTNSGFWGGLLTVQDHVIGPKTYQSRVVLRPNNTITVHAGENVNGVLSDFKFRNVVINGLFADVFGPLSGTVYSADEQLTGMVWTDGKPVYWRTFSGTTPNNTADNKLFDLPGATKIIKFESVFTQNGYDRVIQNWPNGAAHGQGFQFYKVNSVWEGHSYNSVGDARFQGMSYDITVYYTK